MSTLATRKKDFLKILEKCLGVVSNAADKFGMDRSVHYKWMKADKKYKQAVDDIEMKAVDFAESKLFELIGGVETDVVNAFVIRDKDGNEKVKTVSHRKKASPDVAATIFYLKTKGKSRGYIEKIEHDHGDLPPTSIHITMDQVPPGMELPSSEDQVDLTRGK